MQKPRLAQSPPKWPFLQSSSPAAHAPNKHTSSLATFFKPITCGKSLPQSPHSHTPEGPRAPQPTATDAASILYRTKQMWHQGFSSPPNTANAQFCIQALSASGYKPCTPHLADAAFLGNVLRKSCTLAPVRAARPLPHAASRTHLPTRSPKTGPPRPPPPMPLYWLVRCPLDRCEGPVLRRSGPFCWRCARLPAYHVPPPARAGGRIQDINMHTARPDC